MNTGIKDAVNLSWKLAARIQGWGGARLLDTYGYEQKPVAERMVAESTGNLRRMLSPRVNAPSPEIFEEGPGSEEARIAFGNRYTEQMRREWFSIGIHLGDVFEGSPIVVPDGTPRPPEEVSTYTPTARPGSRAPHVWLAEGKSTLDLFGKEFVLLRFGQDAPDGSALEAAARQRGLPLRAEAIDHAQAAAVYGRRLVLVRPDGHVAWRADEAPADAMRVVDAVRGAL